MQIYSINFIRLRDIMSLRNSQKIAEHIRRTVLFFKLIHRNIMQY